MPVGMVFVMKRFGVFLFWLNLALGLAVFFCNLAWMSVPAFLIYGFWLCFGGFAFYGVICHGLFSFVTARILSSCFLIFIIATLIFLLLRLLPGGPFDEERVLPDFVKKSIEKKYRLDQPLVIQYRSYMTDLLKGQLGHSYRYEGRQVSEIIKESFPVSFQLGFYALVFSFLVGVPLGLMAAAHHNTKVDSMIMVLAGSGVCLPGFLMAPLLIYLFGFGWPLNQWFPGLHQVLVDHNILLPVALWQGPRHYILPVIALGVRPAASIARLVRASVLDAIRSDFVRTARSKGLSRKAVLWRHVLKNSLIPVLTYGGPLVAGILSGSFVVEIIFAIPGMAKYFVHGVLYRDYPLVMALALLFSLMLILSNLIVDVLYKMVDPRVEFS